MTQAGVKAYRRMNPGSKLSTAVTEDKPGPNVRHEENLIVQDQQVK
jgi:hypothetical protein